MDGRSIGPGWHENSRFFLYYTWFQSAQGVLLERSGSDVPLFPGALPYPEVINAFVGGVSAEEEQVRWAKSYMNMVVGWSNFLALGCPDSGGVASEPRVGYRCLEEVRKFADELLGEVVEFAADDLRKGVLNCTGKRKLLEQSVHEAACIDAYGGRMAALVKAQACVALPVQAGRVAVPEHAGLVDPVALLPPDRARVVADLESLRLPEALWGEVVKACHRVPLEEETGLMLKLLETGMVTLLPEDQLPRSSTGDLMVGGLFCVAKNETEDRLILDRRPQNATMSRLVWAHLPAGACFCRMLLKDTEILRGSGDDLRNYYYSLRLPENWIKYNAVGRRVAPQLVQRFGKDPAIPHRACFRVLGMGDVNACDIAQAVHEAVLRKEGMLLPDTTLLYGQPVPDGPLWEGIYLDDLLVTYKMDVGQVVTPDFEPPEMAPSDADALRMAAAERGYEQAGLHRAEHKAFRGQVFFKAWGAAVDGLKGRVGAPLEVRQQVWQLLWRVAHEGFSTLVTMQKLMGFVCFAFQYKRELYALQHHVYQFIGTMHCSRRCWIPPQIRDELLSMALYLPFCFWDMRKQVNPVVLATDATPTSGGAVEAGVTEELSMALWRLAEVRGEAVRLDRDEDMLAWNKGAPPKEPSVFASTVAECLDWKVVSSYSFRQTSHINLQEARALKREIIRESSDFSLRKNIKICLNDSRVCCGAFAKGRSSSFKLNGIMRGLVPFLVFAQLTLALLWVETASNIADYPSRFSPLPPPRSPPCWLRALGVGSNNKFGIEIFAGTARLTRAFVDAGFQMHDPVEIELGRDVFDPWLDWLLAVGLVAWAWFAPPCGSFSPLRNLDIGGPLRPKGCPEGDESNPQVLRGNQLWRRALELIDSCILHGIPFTLEHPLGSKAWLLDETQPFFSRGGARPHVVHWCAYKDDRVGPPNKKPTRLLSTFPWLPSVVRQCPGCLVHGPPLRGTRAKLAGAYPLGFCGALAKSYQRWLDGAVGSGWLEPFLS